MSVNEINLRVVFILTEAVWMRQVSSLLSHCYDCPCCCYGDLHYSCACKDCDGFSSLSSLNPPGHRSDPTSCRCRTGWESALCLVEDSSCSERWRWTRFKFNSKSNSSWREFKSAKRCWFRKPLQTIKLECYWDNVILPQASGAIGRILPSHSGSTGLLMRWTMGLGR